jgi:hypothetical protein
MRPFVDSRLPLEVPRPRPQIRIRSAGPLVAGGHQLEEQVGGFGFEGDVGHLVDNQQGVAAQSHQFLLENRILDEMFDVLQPAALTATAQALGEVDVNYRRDLAVFELAVERAATKPDRALRQFDNVEPEKPLSGKLFGGTLEAKLAGVRAAENHLAARVADTCETLREPQPLLEHRHRVPLAIGLRKAEGFS